MNNNSQTVTNSVDEISQNRQAFGNQLARLRESKGFTTQELADINKISIRFIAAMEDGSFKDLPGKVFIRGFIKNICRTLAIDPQDLLTVLDGCYQDEEDQQAKAAAKEESKNFYKTSGAFLGTLPWLKSSLKNIRVILPIIGIVSLGLVYKYFSSTKAQEPVAQSADSSGEQAAIDATGDLTSSEASAERPNLIYGDEAPVAAPEALPVKTFDTVTSETSEKPVAPAVNNKKKGSKIETDILQSEPGKKAPGLVMASTREGSQRLKILVKTPVNLRMRMDEGDSVAVSLTPGSYDYSFKSKAQLLIFDAAAVDLTLNDKSLGSQGGRGETKKLSLVTEGSVIKKL